MDDGGGAELLGPPKTMITVSGMYDRPGGRIYGGSQFGGSETEAVSDGINRGATRTPCLGVYLMLNRM